jgi:hypothetical protein
MPRNTDMRRCYQPGCRNWAMPACIIQIRKARPDFVARHASKQLPVHLSTSEDPNWIFNVPV